MYVIESDDDDDDDDDPNIDSRHFCGTWYS
jgi:hypothetical protein